VVCQPTRVGRHVLSCSPVLRHMGFDVDHFIYPLGRWTDQPHSSSGRDHSRMAGGRPKAELESERHHRWPFDGGARAGCSSTRGSQGRNLSRRGGAPSYYTARVMWGF
jgi:hypothetical protein